MSVLILAGASGSGKTTICKEVGKLKKSVQCYFFDSVGVPSNEEMIAKYGSGQAWQEQTTDYWLNKIDQEFERHQNILLEGQMNLKYLTEKINKVNSKQFITLVLIDCNNEVRKKRLTERGQSELADEHMMNWAQLLRVQATERNLQIIDTSLHETQDSVQEVLKLFV